MRLLKLIMCDRRMAVSYALCALLIGSGCSRPANALVLAARRGDTNAIAKLVAKGVPIDSVEAGALRQTALAAASGYDNAAIVEFLLKNGANPNVPSGQFGTTPLIEAIMLGDHNLPIIRMLIDAGGDPNIADSRGNRPLDYAGSERKGIVEFLIGKGAVRAKSARTSDVQTDATNTSEKSVPFKVQVAKPQ